MKEILNMKEIEEAVSSYSGTLKEFVGEHVRMFGYDPSNKKATINRLKENIELNEARLSSFMDVLKELVSENLVTKDSMLVYVELVTNKELRNKIRFISDGSYYNCRLWVNCTSTGKLSIYVDEVNGLSLQEIVEEYDVIPLQIPYKMENGIEGVKEWIKRERDCYDDDSYYDY